jgi:hypothetical protein
MSSFGRSAQFSQRHCSERAVIALLSVLMAGVMFACGGSKSSNPDPDGPHIAERVTVVDTIAGLRFDQKTANTLDFVYTGTAPAFAVDDILVGTADSGFLRRVASIADSDSTLSITTTDAALTDVIIDGGFVTALELPISEGSSAPVGLARLYPVQLAHGVSVTDDGIDLNGLELFAGTVDGVDLNFTVTEGSVDFSSSIDVGVQITDGVMSEFHALAGGDLELICDMTLAAGGPVSHSREMHIATFESVIVEYIGAIPVTEVVTLEYTAGFTATTDAADTVETSSVVNYDLLLGGRTHDVGWLSIWNPQVTTAGDVEYWPRESSLDFEVFIQPSISIAFYGMSGPTLEANTSVHLVGERIPPLSWRLNFAGSVDGEMHRDLCALNGEQQTLSTEFPVHSEVIIADSGAVIETWERIIGGEGSDRGEAVKPTADGGFIIVGSTDSYGNGRQDVYLVKVDVFGEIEWEKTYGHIDNDIGRDVKVLPDGGYVIAAHTTSFGSQDKFGWILRTDPNGDTLWTNLIGWDVDARSIVASADGGFLFAGRGRLKQPTYMGLYLAKLSASGALEWETTYPDIITAAEVIQLPSGEYVATGYLENRFYSEAFLLKMDEGGNEIWTRSYGGICLDFGEGLVLGDDGELVVAGTTCSFSGADNDVYLLKTDSEGDLQWSRSLGDPNEGEVDESGRAIARSPNGGYVIVGRSNALDNFGDAYVLKINSLGTLLWQRFFGGTRVDGAESVAAAPDGGYIVVGTTSSFGNGSTDIYVIRTNERGIVSSPSEVMGTASP